MLGQPLFGFVLLDGVGARLLFDSLALAAKLVTAAHRSRLSGLSLVIDPAALKQPSHLTRVELCDVVELIALLVE